MEIMINHNIFGEGFQKVLSFLKLVMYSDRIPFNLLHAYGLLSVAMPFFLFWPFAGLKIGFACS